MAVVFSNNAKTTLASNISTSATSITVLDGSVFPVLSGSDYTYVTFENLNSTVEIVKVTALSGNTLTVVRAQDNTSASAFTAGDKCELRLTAAGLNEVANQADTDTNTTYSIQDGELSQNNFTNADHTKLNGIAASANNYTHPSAHSISFITGLQTALDGKVDDSQVLTNVPSGALFTDTNTTYSVGNGGLTQQNFTNADHAKLDGIATGANNYTLPAGYATESYVATEISNLVDSSPAALDTLNELAAALGDDPNFATTVNSNIASKLPLAGGTLTGNLGINANVGGFALNVYHTTNYEPVLFQTNQGGSLARFKDNVAQIEIGVQNGNPVIRTSNLARLTVSGADVLINSGALKMGSTTVIDASRNLTNIGTISSGVMTATGGNSTNWNTAYGWGNHASAGYFLASDYTNVFKSGAEIAGSQDLNNYRTTGYYAQDSNSDATSGSNYPVNAAGILEVISGDQGNGVQTEQRYSRYNTNNKYVRHYYNGTWTAWAEQWNSSSDGSGSGLDADLLDGQQGSYYYAASNPSGYTNNTGTMVETGTTFNGTYNLSFRIGANSYYSHAGMQFTGSTSTLNVNGNITLGGTVDGRNVATDGTKLDGIAAGATANVGDITGVTAGTGLTGGGTSGTPTLNVIGGDGITANADNITVDSTVFRNNGAQYLQHNTTSSEALTFKNSTSGGLIQIGFQQNDTDGMHHRAYLTAWKGSSSASGNVDLIVRGSGGSLTSDILSLRSGNASPTWRGQTIWNAGNHGSNSGLDADLLDGQQGSYYYAASNPNGYTSNVGDITAVTAGTGLTGGATSGAATLNVIGGDGITANANDIAVDSSVIRTTGTQTIGGAKTFSDGTIYMAGNLAHVSDTNTYMGFHANDQWRVVTGGTERLECNNSYVSVAGSLRVANKIEHTGDTDTYMSFDAADQWKLYCGGLKMIQATESGTGYDYISFGGTDNSGEILFNLAVGDGHFDGNLYAYSTTTSSDRKLKKNIQPLEGALEKVQNLRGVSFEWKKDDKKSIGFIAQEVQEVVPDLVKLNRKEHDGVLVSEHLGVDYGNITALLVEAMKEQQETINKLEARILALEKGEE